MQKETKQASVIGIMGSLWYWVVLWFSKEIVITSETFLQQIVFNVLLVSLILILIVYKLSKKRLFYVSFVPSLWILVNFLFLEFTQIYSFGYWIISALLIGVPIGLSLYAIKDWIVKK